MEKLRIKTEKPIEDDRFQDFVFVRIKNQRAHIYEYDPIKDVARKTCVNTKNGRILGFTEINDFFKSNFDEAYKKLEAPAPSLYQLVTSYNL